MLVILVLSSSNCQVDEQVLKSNEAHNAPDKGKISFKQFATETDTQDFKTAIAIHNNNKIDNKSNNEFSEFYIDTIAIKKLISKNQKASYTFRIYPLFKKNEPSEFYNLVYHKVNDSWTTSVFLLKKNLNPNIKNRPFETIEKITSQLKVPNKTQKTAAECFQFYTEIRCDGSCPGVCDGLGCETGVCYFVGIAQISCGGGSQTSTTPINYPSTDNNNSGGGSYNDFVFTPNTLKNLDINDPNYVNDWHTTNVWNDLNGTEKLFFRYDAQNKIFYDQTIQYQIDNNWSSESTVIANSLRNAKFENPNMNFDVEASSKSTTEGAKFNEVYDALKKSPEFKKLFIDLFDGSQTRFNVQFEIADNLPSPKKPAEQDNGQTILTQNSTNIIIKINRQILIPITGGINNLSKMAIAKVILHECIHAYLHIKGMYPNAGVSVPGIEDMDLQTVINTIYGAESDQHTFMYERMVQTMRNILTTLKDKLTTEERRNALLDLKIYTKTDFSAFEIWNWDNYFKYLSLSGLSETKIFIKDFPNNSDALRTFNNYNVQGENYLNKN